MALSYAADHASGFLLDCGAVLAASIRPCKAAMDGRKDELVRRECERSGHQLGERRL